MVKGNHRDESACFAISDSIPVASIDGRRAASQVTDAARHGDADLVITLPARLAVIANAAAAFIITTANTTLLPPAKYGAGTEAHSGWQSLSDWAPSKLTRRTDRAARENNELPPAR